MKFLISTTAIIAALVLITTISFAQNANDTCLTRQQWIDLKHQISQLKESNRERFYKIKLLTELSSIDTIAQTSDSLVLKYTGKDKKVLKKEKQIFRKGCITDSIVTHYNKTELVEYIESWKTTCDSPDTIDNDIAIFKYMQSRSRYEYDKEGRVSKYVFRISTPLSRRILFSYDAYGKRSEVVVKISEDEFWD